MPSFSLPRKAAFVACSWTCGCASIPAGRSVIDEVTIRGATAVDEGDVEEKIATADSPRFLGLFQGFMVDYEILDRLVLQRDLARVERLYRARGYYGARVRAGRVIRTKGSHVRVEILVEEGKPVLVADVLVEGVEALPGDVAAAVRRAAEAHLKAGSPFDEDELRDAEKAATLALTDQGYARAKVQRDAAVDLGRRTADVALTVDAGAPATFGEVSIEGLGDLPEAPVRRALDIHPGEPYSTRAIESAKQAALDLGVLSAIQITPVLDGPPAASGQVPIRVRLELSKLRTLRLGGGFELDAVKSDVHALVGWEDKNFLGGFRRYAVTLRPGVVLYPLRVDHWGVPERLLPELKLQNELRQPGFIEARTTGFLAPQLNVFPVLLEAQTTPDEPVLGYLELRNIVGVDRTFWKLFGALSYDLQIERPFSYAGALDPALRTLILAYPELVVNLDVRDDPVHPHKGVFVGNDLQAAGGPFGGHARDVKVQSEVRGYVPVTKRVTWATRGMLGFLFPFNYGDVVRDSLLDPLTPENRAARTRDLQIVYFRGFFSGGPSSNRGYPARAIGPAGVAPFLTPDLAAQQIARDCDPSRPAPEVARCSVPVGGFSLWEASTELRIGITGPLSLATFCDASDVSPQTGDVRLDHLHLSCGLGARYDTPVGPVRLDVGYRVPGVQVLGGPDPAEREPDLLFGWAPIAIDFGIGEAF